ncbi:hypothetical protein LJC64_00680 [Ruminococcaceae bacterium OttesenSCG-928-A11]|nr:hypothetical protein [Ruminococcaceae bacterium OttesenSCG-928-A11]
MPKIVRYGGLSLSDEVVRIRDVAPAPEGGQKPAVKKAAEPGEDDFVPLDLDAAAVDDGDSELDLPDGEDSGDFADAPAFERTEAPAHRADAGAAQTEIIQAAMGEAGRIIEDAVREAQDRKAEILAEARYEADRMQQEAAEEGRKQGLADVTGDVQAAADGLQGAIASFEGERAGFEAEYEEQLRWLAIEIAGKVLAKKVAEDDAEMTQMVDKAVQTVRSEPWIRIEVAQEMIRLIDSLTALYDGQAGIDVSGIPAAPGTVHIETPSGVVDASLNTQLANLREYFSRNAE